MKKSHRFPALALAALAALLAACGTGKKDAEAFLRTAARSGMKEVVLSRLALERAQRPEVRDFARRMVEEHERTNEEVLGLAQRKRVRLQDTARDPVMDDRLSERAGRDFDLEYMRLNVEEHEKAVELFRAQARDGKDTGIRAFAGRVLPALEEHLEMARGLRDRIESGDDAPRDTSAPANRMHGESMRIP